MERIGVVVNPVAGMGGRVGLKGTDGKVAEALRRGAEPRAPSRAVDALEVLYDRRPDLEVVTADGAMGADAAREAGYDPVVVYQPEGEAWPSTDADDAGTATDAEDVQMTTDAGDTRAAVRAFADRGVDLVLFVGGDGTAVDVASALESAGDESEDGGPPVLGVPAGVKVYSSVFAVRPEEAGRIAASFDRVEQREVNDIDEEAYREGEVRASLRAVVPVPVASGLQSSKQLAGGSVETLAAGFAREVDPETTYVFGPGGTVGAIEEELGIDPSPLGVDVWRDGDLLAYDAAESDVLAALDAVGADRDGERSHQVSIVVSPIGGQGFVFGRGNHQLSPAVIERATVIEVVASEEKLDGLDVLRVDTGDDDVDEALRGWCRVRTGRFTTRLVEIV